MPQPELEALRKGGAEIVTSGGPGSAGEDQPSQLSVEQLLERLSQIQQFTLLYPPLGDKGPNRVATLLSKQTLTQQALAACLGLDQLGITPRR
jgi:hypothetical protein